MPESDKKLVYESFGRHSHESTFALGNTEKRSGVQQLLMKREFHFSAFSVLSELDADTIHN